MEMTGLLLNELASLFMIMAIGFAIVKLNVVRREDSRILSILIIYIVCPCVILRSFQIDFSPQVKEKFMLSVGVALGINLILVLITSGYKALFRLDPVEQASIMYANAGNLIIPLVMAILGEEWVVYASAFMCVQLCFIWTYGKARISGVAGGSWKRILLNTNLLAIIVGAVLLLAGIKLPPILNNVLSQLSEMMGPLTMIMVGMLLANVDWRNLITQTRVYLILVLKMIVTPLLILFLLKATGVAEWVDDGKTLVYISFMAVITPTATTVTQLAELYHNRSEYACALNALTTIICIITMPIMTWLYFLIM